MPVANRGMSHAYSITTAIDAIRQLLPSGYRLELPADSGGMVPQTGVYPGMTAPVIRRSAAGALALSPVWWGMPTPQNVIWKRAKARADRLIERHHQPMSPDEFEALQMAEPDPGAHNVRNTESPHWRRWLGPECRVVVPFNSFAEWSDLIGPGGRKHGNTWFALGEDRPPAFFAGVMAERWTSIRRIGQAAMTTDLFAFLTTEPNAEVRAVQESMPVILRSCEEVEQWLTAPWDEARQLKRPLPDGSLTIVAIGSKEDPPEKALEPPLQPTLF